MQDLYVITLFVVLALGLITAILFLSGIATLDADGDVAEIAPNGGFDLETDIDIGDGFDADVAEPDANFTENGDMPMAGDVPSRRRTPFMIRLVAFLAGFGTIGINASLTLTWAGAVGEAIAFALALAGGKVLQMIAEALFRKILPKDITTAINISHMRRAKGVVMEGTMTSMRSAQVRIRDCHGGMHQVVARCLDPQISIPSGTSVLITRKLDPQTNRISYAAVPLA